MDVLDTATVAYLIGATISAVAVIAAIILSLELLSAEAIEQKSMAVGLLLGSGLVVMVAAWIGLQLDLAHDVRNLTDALDFLR